jgi:hypothetical protein
MNPRMRILKSMGVSADEYQVALQKALERHASKKYRNTPIFEVPIYLNGKRYKLEETTKIVIKGNNKFTGDLTKE